MTAIYAGEAPRGWLPWGLLAPFLAIAFIILPGLPFEIALEGMGLTTPQGDPAGSLGLAAFLLFPFGAMALTVMAWVRLVERRSLSSIGLDGPGMAPFGRGWLLGLGSIGLVTIAGWAFGGYQASAFFPALASPAALANILMLLAAFAIQASAEEVLFRGWLLSVTSRRFNVPAGILLSTAVFTLVHYSRGQHWMATLGVALFSVFTCAWALHVRSIWGVMGWHVGWNWLLAVGFDVPVTGLDAGVPALLVSLRPNHHLVLNGGPQGPEASVFCLLFFAISIAYLLRRGSAPARAPGGGVDPSPRSQPAD